MKRLKDKYKLQLYLKQKFRHRARFFDIILVPNSSYNTNFANIIISKKNVPLASDRNLIKRRFRAALNLIFNYNYNKYYVIIVLIKSKDICKLSFQSILQEIQELNLLN